MSADREQITRLVNAYQVEITTSGHYGTDAYHALSDVIFESGVLSGLLADLEQAEQKMAAASTMLAEAEKIVPGVISTAARFSIGLNDRERAEQAERERDGARLALESNAPLILDLERKVILYEEALRQVADPTFVGNYSDNEIVGIYREWAKNALAAGAASSQRKPE